MSVTTVCKLCRQPVKTSNYLAHLKSRCPSRKLKLPVISRASSTESDHRSACPKHVAIKMLKEKEEVNLSYSGDAFFARTGKFRCVQCGDWVRNTLKRRHFQDDRFLTIRKQSAGKMLADWRGCHHCSEVLPPDEMGAHLHSMHPRAACSDRNLNGRLMIPEVRREHEVQYSTVLRFIPIWQEDVSADVKRHAEGKQRTSLDGSVRFAHMRRESDGRIGSYPLHDGYGEESNM